jgi:hypothetical protein
MEATGYSRWFERLLAELGMELWIGDAAEIKTKRVRKQKTDRPHTQLLLKLMVEDRFPRVWVPNPENRDLRQLLWHRHRFVQMRTRIMNQLRAMAMNEGKRWNKRLWKERGRAELAQLQLPPWTSRRRQDLTELLDRLNPTIEELTAAEQEAMKRPEVLRLMTLPGVGFLTALAFVLVIGTPERFRCGKQIFQFQLKAGHPHSNGTNENRPARSFNNRVTESLIRNSPFQAATKKTMADDRNGIPCHFVCELAGAIGTLDSQSGYFRIADCHEAIAWKLGQRMRGRGLVVILRPKQNCQLSILPKCGLPRVDGLKSERCTDCNLVVPFSKFSIFWRMRSANLNQCSWQVSPALMWTVIPSETPNC